MIKNKFFILFAIIHLSFIDTSPESYTLDNGHTYIGFDVERFLVGEVSGRFNNFSANITMENDDYTTLQMQTTIDVESLDSNNETRDGHLKGTMWLDAKNHPNITFKSSGVVKKGDNNYIMKGEFTIRGVTNIIQFPIQVLGPFKDPTQKTAIGIRADFIIDRFDYGIKFNKKMDNGSLFIGNEVKIKIRALAYMN